MEYISFKAGSWREFAKIDYWCEAQIRISHSKYEELELPCATRADLCSSSDSDSDLESVPDKDGYEETVVPAYLPPTRPFGSEDQPGPSRSNMSNRKRKVQPTSKLPHDIELYEASQKEMSTPTFSLYV